MDRYSYFPLILGITWTFEWNKIPVLSFKWFLILRKRELKYHLIMPIPCFLSVGAGYQKSKISNLLSIAQVFWVVENSWPGISYQDKWMLIRICFLMHSFGIEFLEEWQWVSTKHLKLNMQRRTLDFTPWDLFSLVPPLSKI